MGLGNFRHLDIRNYLSITVWVYPHRKNMIIFDNRVEFDYNE